MKSEPVDKKKEELVKKLLKDPDLRMKPNGVIYSKPEIVGRKRSLEASQ